MIEPRSLRGPRRPAIVPDDAGVRLVEFGVRFIILAIVALLTFAR